MPTEQLSHHASLASLVDSSQATGRYVLTREMEDQAFLNDVPPLLALGVSFDPSAARERVQDAILRVVVPTTVPFDAVRAGRGTRIQAGRQASRPVTISARQLGAIK